MLGGSPNTTQSGSVEDSRMDDATLQTVEADLKAYLALFADCFPYKPTSAHLEVYVRGQLGTLERKSIEPIALGAGVAPRTLQQFVGALRWNEDVMRSRVRTLVVAWHPDPNAVGVIDETSFEKKGCKTIGVKRQWCGHKGKVDNCVQTVHLTYVARQFATIIGGDIYLPEDWADDRARRERAGVPDHVKFRTKPEIALEVVDRARADGISMRWVTADEFYGRSSEFRDGLELRNLLYVLEVPKSTFGWTRAGYAEGREHRRVDQLYLRGGPTWVDYHVKDTTKGPVVWRVRATRFVFHAGTDRSEKWLLIAVDPLTGETKYFVSNASADTPVETLLTVAFTRWRVERNFEDSKQEIGLDHFEVRTYTALQRHLALSMVSMLFLVETTLKLKDMTSQGWTVSQTRLIVDTMVDQELLPEQRARRLENNLFKIAYWQRRARVAEKCHRKRRLLELAAAGIDMKTVPQCPSWPNGP
jgi:SRSO17 transposase